jgi:hypothetical protein
MVTDLVDPRGELNTLPAAVTCNKNVVYVDRGPEHLH